MYPRHAYQQSSPPPARIDLILEIYDRLLARFHQAKSLLADKPEVARLLLAPCQAAVSGIAAGLDISGGEVNENFLRLYEFVGHCLIAGTQAKIQDAIDVLTPLRDAFSAARPEALNLERQGKIPSLDQSRLSALAY